MMSPMPVPKFDIGEKLQVPPGTVGAPIEFYDAYGFVVDRTVQAMGPSLPEDWEPIYILNDFSGDFGYAGAVAVREAWLIRAV